MAQKPSAELLAAMRSAPRAAPSNDKLERARDLVRQMRDTQREISDAEEVLSERKQRFEELRHKTVPDFFAELGVNIVGLEAEGNQPAVEAKLRPYYKASISKDWPDARRDEAFDLLEQLGVGSIVRRVFVVDVDRENQKEIKRIRALLSKASVDYLERRDVPWSTLTATVRELSEAGEVLSPEDLTTIGAVIGHIVEVKEQKGKKR